MTSIDNVCGVIGIFFGAIPEGRHDIFAMGSWIYAKGF